MAAPQFLTIPEFGGTLRLNRPQDRIGVGDLQVAHSVILDRQDGMVSLGPGYLALNGSALDQTANNALGRRGPTRYQASGTKVYRGFTNVIKTGLNQNVVSMVNYNDGKGNQWTYFVGGGAQFKDDGSDVHDMGSAAPTTAPTTSLSTGSHTLTTVTYVYTYKNSKTGYETNPSPTSASVSPSAQGVLVSGILASADVQIDKIRIYRKDSTLGTHYFAFERNNGTTSWDDTGSVANTDLGDAVEEDNDLIGSELILAGPLFNRLFATGATSNILTWSKPYADGKGRAEQWPALNNIEVGSLDDGIVDLVIAYGSLLLPSSNGWQGLTGSTSATFFVSPLRIDRGLASRGAWNIIPAGILYLGFDGLYVTNGSGAQVVYDSLRPLFQGQTINGIPPINIGQISRCRMASNKQFVYLSYPAEGSDFPNRVVRLHKSKEQATILPWTANSIFFEREENLLIFGDDTGFVFKESGFTLNGSGQTITIETSAMRDGNDPFTLFRVKRPRVLVIDIDTDGQNVSVDVMMDGVLAHTKTVNTLSRQMVTIDNINATRGIRVHLKLTGTLTKDFALYGVWMQYEPGEIKYG